MLGFAVVGCGMIARFHARALAEVPGARLVALVSRHPANAQKLNDEGRSLPPLQRRQMMAQLRRALPEEEAVG